MKPSSNKYPPLNMYPSSTPNYIIDILERLGRIETKLDEQYEQAEEKKSEPKCGCRTETHLCPIHEGDWINPPQQADEHLPKFCGHINHKVGCSCHLDKQAVCEHEPKVCQCGEKPRVCFTGRKWLVTCDTEDCPKRAFGKTKEQAIDKWNGYIDPSPKESDREAVEELAKLLIEIYEGKHGTTKCTIGGNAEFCAQVLLNKGYRKA